MLLALETSGPSLGVALNSNAGRTVFAEDVEAGAVHGKALAPQIVKALASQAIQPDQLNGIAISIGPGSWTGLRIGLSAAKAMAWALRIPLIPVPSFEALARRGQSENPTLAAGTFILCLRDARSEGCFSALFHETGGRLERCIQECVLPAADVLDAVEAVEATRSKRIVLCGDAGPVEKVLGLARNRGLDWSDSGARSIRASDLAACAQARFDAGEGLKESASIHAAAPMYLRRSDPELKLERKA